MDFVREHLILLVIGGFIAITVLQVLFRARAFFNGNDPAKMQLLMGRQEMSDSAFHSAYYADVEQTLVTTARYLFANRARVPHNLLLPTDRLADFGIQDLGDMVMGGVKKAQQEKQLPPLPVEKLDTLDDMIKLERWMLQNSQMQVKHSLY
jgi:hypothetical protein